MRWTPSTRRSEHAAARLRNLRRWPKIMPLIARTVLLYADIVAGLPKRDPCRKSCFQVMTGGTCVADANRSGCPHRQRKQPDSSKENSQEPLMYNVILALHIIAGSVALLSMIVPMVAAK